MKPRVEAAVRGWLLTNKFEAQASEGELPVSRSRQTNVSRPSSSGIPSAPICGTPQAIQNRL